MSKFLDMAGLSYLWQKCKATFALCAHTHANASVDAAGLMSAADKAALDKLEQAAPAAGLWRKQTGALAQLRPVPESALDVAVQCVTTETPPVVGTKSPSNPSTLTGADSVSVTRCGKNLCPRFTTQVYASAGITLTVDDDGRVTFSGTAVAQRECPGAQITLPAGQYTVSGAPSGSASGAYDVLVKNVGTGSYIGRSYDGSPLAAFMLTSMTTVEVRLRVPAGAMDSAKVFAPQLEAGSVSTVYEPYIGTGFVLTPSAAVYGLAGAADVVHNDGSVVRRTGYIASYAGETLPGAWLSTMDAYAAGATPTTGAAVVYALATPTTTEDDFTPVPIAALSQSDKFTPRENAVYGGGKGLEVGYRYSPIAAYEELTAAIVSLGDNV